MANFLSIVVQLWYKSSFQTQNPLKIKGLESGAGGIRIIIARFPLLSTVRILRKINTFSFPRPPPVMLCYPAIVVQLWYRFRCSQPLKYKL